MVTKKVKRGKGKYQCFLCGKTFYRYRSQISTSTPSCSYSCSNKYSKRNHPYVRTKEHRKKMSVIVSMSPHCYKQHKAITRFNKSKKGMSYKEFYGQEKAYDIKEKLSSSFSGKKNPNFIDGRSFFPYPFSFNKRLKKDIKKIDGSVCVRCGITDSEIRRKDSLGRGITIHHIDFNKNNCSHENLVCTCRVCNSWSNFHRNESQDFFVNYIKERFLYA